MIVWRMASNDQIQSKAASTRIIKAMDVDVGASRLYMWIQKIICATELITVGLRTSFCNVSSNLELQRKNLFQLQQGRGTGW